MAIGRFFPEKDEEQFGFQRGTMIDIDSTPPLDHDSVPEYEDVAGGGVCEHRYEVGDGESPHLA